MVQTAYDKLLRVQDQTSQVSSRKPSIQLVRDSGTRSQSSKRMHQVNISRAMPILSTA